MTFGFGPGTQTNLTRLADQFAGGGVVGHLQTFFPHFLAKARRMISTRKVCGVCTAHNRERSKCRAMNSPSSESLIVSDTGWAATAAPSWRARRQSSPRSRPGWCRGGRRPGWPRFRRAGESACRPFQTESCRSLPPATRRNGLVKRNFAAKFGKGALHAVAHDQDDFVNERRAVESLPGVGDERAAGDGQKQLVRLPPHAGAFAGGDDDGGGHEGWSWRARRASCLARRMAARMLEGLALPWPAMS